MRTAITTGATNTDRHGKISMSPAPMAGAMIGTIKNTAMMNDISRAITSPSKRSRTIALVSVRGPAAPIPHTNRAAMRSGHELARADNNPPTM